MHAVAYTPAEPSGPRHSPAWIPALRPTAAAFPMMSLGRLPHQRFRGLNSVHCCYGLQIRGAAIQPFPSRASADWLPTRPSRLLPGVMTISRTGLSPARLHTFFTAHDIHRFAAPALLEDDPPSLLPIHQTPFHPRQGTLAHVTSFAPYVRATFRLPAITSIPQSPYAPSYVSIYFN